MNISSIQPNYYYSHKANLGPLPRGPGAEDERNIVMHNLLKKHHFVIVISISDKLTVPIRISVSPFS